MQVSVKRGVTYTRCVSGQTSTSGLPCEAGVIAYDSVDGASIQDRVRARAERVEYCPQYSVAHSHALFVPPSVILQLFKTAI